MDRFSLKILVSCTLNPARYIVFRSVSAYDDGRFYVQLSYLPLL